MTHSKRLPIASLLLVAAITLLPTVALAAGGPPPTLGVHLTPIGNPIWKPVDFHLFSAPLGTAASGYVEFGETMAALLPPPNHVPHPQLGIGPGAPHQPPYDGEMAAGVAAQGYRETVRFRPSEFRRGMAVWTTWMNVPNPGTTGSSPDFLSGPIIPDSLFPIHVMATSTRNGAPYSTVFEGDVPALNAVIPPFAVDGHSHFPFFLADNSDFGPPGMQVNGSYAWSITMTDTSGNGWQIDVNFLIGGWGNQ